jgi:hypothetical protein
LNLLSKCCNRIEKFFWPVRRMSGQSCLHTAKESKSEGAKSGL